MPSSASSWPVSAAPTCGSTAGSPSCAPRLGRARVHRRGRRGRRATSRTSRSGDFVIAPFSWSDGTCRNCEAGFHTACVHGGFFGQGGDGDGGQAEYVRVPQADGTLVTFPARTSPTRRWPRCSRSPTSWHRLPRRGQRRRHRTATRSQSSVTALSVCPVCCPPSCSAPSGSSCSAAPTRTVTRWPASGAPRTSSTSAARRLSRCC